ncbi:MAG TPA: beta-ketoacyl-[acyl-carrier-protein] synthase II, partial [Planctomycetaceae bacterium]|nr:beta-ketoacyl-[acyl-carrier-protein] synthase II [Planctomycetaceae bacterium]
MNEPIAITGMGICCPLGNSLAEVAENLLAGNSGVRPIQSFDATLMTMNKAGEVLEMPPADRYDRSLYRIW